MREIPDPTKAPEPPEPKPPKPPSFLKHFLIEVITKVGVVVGFVLIVPAVVLVIVWILSLTNPDYSFSAGWWRVTVLAIIYLCATAFFWSGFWLSIYYTEEKKKWGEKQKVTVFSKADLDAVTQRRMDAHTSWQATQLKRRPPSQNQMTAPVTPDTKAVAGDWKTSTSAYTKFYNAHWYDPACVCPSCKPSMHK